MKTLRNMYQQIYDFDNLYAAYLEARKCKRYRQDVLRYSMNLEEGLIQLQNELIYKSYKVGKYREFYVVEPKKRLIMALQFKDRIVQWAVYRQLNPFFDKQFIYDSYGCRVGKGTHNAANRVQYWMKQVSRRSEPYYYLKLDISKYFYRVDHEILMSILRRKIQDEDLLWLLSTIINSETMAFGLPAGINPADCPREDRIFDKGMPIGNLTSQMFANLYLNELDQYAKNELRLHYYIRYMDDVIILHKDKAYLHEVKELIENFLDEQLKLDLNSKTTIRPIKDGIEFVGFRIWPTHRKLKKATAKKIKSRIRYLIKAVDEGAELPEALAKSVSSYKGILEHFNSYGYRKRLNRMFKKR
jgi:retron-type reverse transcriptase